MAYSFDTEASAGSPTFDARPVNSLYGTAIYGLSYYGYTNSYAFDSEKGSSNYSFDNEA
jgi:hypothetical protein